MQPVKTTVMTPEALQELLRAEFGERLAPVNQAKLAKQTLQRANRAKGRPRGGTQE